MLKMDGIKGNPIELLSKPVVYCALCVNQGSLCHDVCYGLCCIKLMYTFLHNSTKVQCFGENFTGWSRESITGVFKQAYNHKCQADLDNRFDFSILTGRVYQIE